MDMNDTSIRMAALAEATAAIGDGYLTAQEQTRATLIVAAGFAEWLERGDVDSAVRVARKLEEDEELGLGEEPELKESGLFTWIPSVESLPIGSAGRASIQGPSPDRGVDEIHDHQGDGS